MSELLRVSNLKKYYPVREGFFLRHVGDVKALDDVSFTLNRGETLGIVGESGCGKSTLGKSIIRLHDPTDGKIFFKGEDFLALSGSELRRRRRDIQMIFQDPFASLDPRMTVGQILREPLDVHSVGTIAEREAKVEELLITVGLKRMHLNSYPHEFSGGQRQRISIARCLALGPELIIADEPVSALDVSVQAQVLNLMKELQAKFNLSYVFISHDLSVVEYMCDYIAVMYLGKIVEIASREELFSRPLHPYTQALIKSIPIVGGEKQSVWNKLGGEVPSPIDPPSGCHFHPRCDICQSDCKVTIPKLQQVMDNPEHRVSCLLVE